MRKVWFEDAGGQGDLLLVLHRGGTDSRAMRPLIDALGQYRVVMFDRVGHGRSADTDQDWSFATTADDAVGVLKSIGAGPAHLVGWSDGAIVVSTSRCDVPIWSGRWSSEERPFDVAGWDAGVLDGGDPPGFMADSYAEVSPDGLDQWPVAVRKAAELHRSEPDITLEQLGTLRMPVMILTGDDDEVRLDHLTVMLDAVPAQNWPSFRAPRTGSSSRNPTSSLSSSGSSTHRTRGTDSRPDADGAPDGPHTQIETGACRHSSPAPRRTSATAGRGAESEAFRYRQR